eukprot:COSAG01_NODE_5463_length_4246_cov_39.670364_3_plen_93_part_00
MARATHVRTVDTGVPKQAQGCLETPSGRTHFVEYTFKHTAHYLARIYHTCLLLQIPLLVRPYGGLGLPHSFAIVRIKAGLLYGDASLGGRGC